MNFTRISEGDFRPTGLSALAGAHTFLFLWQHPVAFVSLATQLFGLPTFDSSKYLGAKQFALKTDGFVNSVAREAIGVSPVLSPDASYLAGLSRCLRCRTPNFIRVSRGTTIFIIAHEIRTRVAVLLASVTPMRLAFDWFRHRLCSLTSPLSHVSIDGWRRSSPLSFSRHIPKPDAMAELPSRRCRLCGLCPKSTHPTLTGCQPH